MATSFYVKNFGCRATQADGAALAADLRARGLGETAQASDADVVVVNTCTVTAEADRDARQTIRRIHRENPASRILVTGCYAQRRPEELAALPGVNWVVGNSHKPQIGEVVTLDSGTLPYHGALVGDIYEQRELLSSPVLGPGQDRSRPNVKVQDGCNNRCSFCIIPSVRGYSRSALPERVLEEIRTLEDRYPEIVLTGINLGRWGRDLPGRPRFTALLERILAETKVQKLRISSVEPMDWTSDLLNLVASEPRIAKHVHIPLQSGSDSVLKRMRRRYRIRHYADRINRARTAMPTAGIGADVMVGFPGETDKEFEETRAFIESAPFTYLHVFTFSAREGTPAATMPAQVPLKLKKERNRILRELAEAKNQAFRESLIGTRLSAVTLDRRAENGTSALTDNFLHIAVDQTSLSPRALVPIALTSPDSAVLSPDGASEPRPGGSGRRLQPADILDQHAVAG